MKNVYHFEDHNSLFFHKFFLDILVPLLFKVGVKSNEGPDIRLDVAKEFLEVRIDNELKFSSLSTSIKEVKIDSKLDLDN